MPLTRDEELELLTLEQERRKRAPLRAKLAPEAGRQAGFPVEPTEEVGIKGIGEEFKKIGKAVVSPDVLIPTVAGGMGFAAGGIPGAMGASAVAGAMVETMKLRKEKGRASSFLEKAIPPPFSMLVTVASSVDKPEEALDILKNATIEGAIEGLGFGAVKALNKAKTFAPFKSFINENVARLEDEFPNLQFNLAQKTDSFVADKMEGLARAGYLSRDRMLRLDRANTQEIHNISKKIAHEFYDGIEDNLSPEQLGKLLNSTFDFGRSAQKTISSKLYAEVDNIIGDAPIVSTRSIKDFSIKELQESTKIADVDLSAQVGRILRRFQKLEDGINFGSAHRLRSFLIELRRSTDLKPGMDRIAKQAIGIIDETMEKSATNLSADAYKAWRRANNFFKSGKETFENELMAKLFVEERKLPSEIGMSIYRYGTVGPKGSVERIRDLRKAIRRASLLAPDKVNYDKTVGAVKHGYFNGLLNRHWKANPDLPGGGTVNFTAMFDELSDVNNQAIMKELFKPEEIKKIGDFIQAGIATQKVASQAGGAFGLVQAGAVFGSGLGMIYRPVEAGVSLAGALWFPKIVASIITNKRSVDLLTRGFKEFSKGTKQSIARAIQLSIRAGREVIDQETARTLRDEFDFEEKLGEKLEKE